MCVRSREPGWLVAHFRYLSLGSQALTQALGSVFFLYPPREKLPGVRAEGSQGGGFRGSPSKTRLAGRHAERPFLEGHFKNDPPGRWRAAHRLTVGPRHRPLLYRYTYPYASNYIWYRWGYAPWSTFAQRKKKRHNTTSQRKHIWDSLTSTIIIDLYPESKENNCNSGNCW